MNLIYQLTAYHISAPMYAFASTESQVLFVTPKTALMKVQKIHTQILGTLLRTSSNMMISIVTQNRSLPGTAWHLQCPRDH